MGQRQHTAKGDVPTRGKRLGPRICLRKGCGRSYQPRRWNQRYCQDAECLRLVRRWQAAKRQRRCRRAPEGRQKHAEAERQRRERCRAGHNASVVRDSSPREAPPCAWSRSRKFPQIFCDRPGCYDPPRSSLRALARYCSDACRSALRRVQDRERKWLSRKTSAGRYKRRLEYERARRRRRTISLSFARGGRCQNGSSDRPAVVTYGMADPVSLSWSDSPEENCHDPETSADSRPRPPPAS
jgi:hypothetical protein